jgi:hypothetical protein
VENFFVQKQRIKHYFDSVSKANATNNSSQKIPYYGEYNRWMEEWKEFMPASGNFDEVFIDIKVVR